VTRARLPRVFLRESSVTAEAVASRARGVEKWVVVSRASSRRSVAGKPVGRREGLT